MKIGEQIIDIILKKINDEYKDDIALLVQYDINSKYDQDGKGVDLFFIPKTEKSYQLSFQFIIEGIGYDLFPMQWDRLLKIASMDSPQAYLFKESKILYVGDNESLCRFNKLKDSLDEVLNGQYSEALLNKAYEYLNDSYIYLYNLQSRCDSLLDIKIESSKLLKQIAQIIAFVNHDYYLGENGSVISIIKDSMNMTKKPENYNELLEIIVHSTKKDEVIKSCCDLVDHTRDLLQEQRELYVQTEPFEVFFKGYYEELKKYMNYLELAIHNNNYFKQFEIASYIHEEVSQFLTKSKDGIWFNDRNVYHEYSKIFDDYFRVDFMNLISKRDKKNLLIELTKFDQGIVELFEDENIHIQQFDSVHSFEDYFL